MFKKGDIIEGKIVQKFIQNNKEMIAIKTQGKFDSYLELKEITKPIEIGEILNFEIVNPHTMLLSYTKALNKIKQNYMQEKLNNFEILEGIIIDKKNNQYKIKLKNLDDNSFGFLNSTNEYNINDIIQVIITKIKNNQKIELMEYHNQLPQKGQKVSVNIYNYNQYFLKVKIHECNLEGLIHKNNLPGKYENIEDFLKEHKILNDKNKIIKNDLIFEAFIIKVYINYNNPTQITVNLSMQTKKNNYKQLISDYKEGEIYDVTVKNILQQNNMMVVQLGENLDGIIHSSEINIIESFDTYFKIGDVLKAKLIEINYNKQSCRFSLKQIQQEQFFKKYKEGDEVQCKVIDIVPHKKYILCTIIGEFMIGMIQNYNLHTNNLLIEYILSTLKKNDVITCEIQKINEYKVYLNCKNKVINEFNNNKLKLNQVYTWDIVYENSQETLVQEQKTHQWGIINNKFIVKNEKNIKAIPVDVYYYVYKLNTRNNKTNQNFSVNKQSNSNSLGSFLSDAGLL